MDKFTKRIPGGNPDKSNLDIWKSRVEQCNGFTEEAAGYVYVIEVERESTGDIFYYVGNSVQHPCHRISSHSKGMAQTSKPVEYKDGLDRMVPGCQERYMVEDVERIVSFIGEGDHLEPMLLEQEREMSYKIAIEYDTTNVLGGH